jgi:peptide/nickel transport system substrate-binding protein
LEFVIREGGVHPNFVSLVLGFLFRNFLEDEMKTIKTISFVVLAFVLLLSACTPASPTAAPAASTSAPIPPTSSPPTPTTDPELLKMGGTLVIRGFQDPDTLDAHRSIGGVSNFVWWYVGASLIIINPETGEFVPYLAESWQELDGGMAYEFKLREDVKFHDGTPLTAEDYVATFQRILDPETMSPVAGTTLIGVGGVELVDDYTFRINMDMPNSTLLESLSYPMYFPPYPKAYIETGSEEDLAWHPVSVGPFKFVDYTVGDTLTLERNPEYTWGPEFTRGAAPYLDGIEIRILPDDVTAIASLEAGELDVSSIKAANQVQQVEGTGLYDVYQYLNAGSNQITMNVSKPPFDDLKVRQAFYHATDRQAVLDVVDLGQGVLQNGPLSQTVFGYWEGVEELAYDYDLEAAQQLMQEAGYTLNADGMLEKDGQILSFEIMVYSGDEASLKTAQILQQQYQQLGADVTLVSLESGLISDRLRTGDYVLTPTQWNWQNYSLLLIYTASMLGVLNESQVNDPTLDGYVMGMMFSGDPAVIDQSIMDAQRYMMEQAYIIPMYTTYSTNVMAKRVQGEMYAPMYFGSFWLNDAYIEE